MPLEPYIGVKNYALSMTWEIIHSNIERKNEWDILEVLGYSCECRKRSYVG